MAESDREKFIKELLKVQEEINEKINKRKKLLAKISQLPREKKVKKQEPEKVKEEEE